MKKLIKVFTLGSLVLGMTSNIAMADSVLVKPMLEDPNIKLGIVQDDSLQEEKINYMSFEGYVKDFENNNGYMSIIMNNGKTDEVIGEFRIFEDIIIVNQDTAESITVDKIEKGQKIRGFYRKDMPMILIYPPAITPELLVVSNQDSKNSIKHSYFDENNVSIDNNLKLNLSDTTLIVDKHGNKVNADKIKNMDLIVIYDVTTRSIPAQTNPLKVIVLEKDAEPGQVDKDLVLEKIISEGYMNGETTMISLKHIAEHYGYVVAWDASAKTITLTKENSSLNITIGDQMYGYNKSIQKFEVAPEIKDARTYVPMSIVSLLQQ